jgi:hypothetical protein
MNRFVKWLLLSVILAPASGNILYAQSNFYEEEYKSFSGGALIGLNLTQVDGDRYFGYNKPGLAAGVFVNVQLTAKWGFGIEMLYSQKGSRGDAVVESVYAGTYVAQCHIGLNYVELPVVVRYKKEKYVGEVGVSYARLVKTRETILEPQPLYIDAERNRFASTDLNYVLGVARHIYKHIYCGVRFHYSIASIRPAERIPIGYGYGNKGQFNNLFSVRLIYQL